MSTHIVPLAKVMLLQRVLENGGTATCPVIRPELLTEATVQVVLNAGTAQLEVTVGTSTGKLTLHRGDMAKYQHLRDFIQELADSQAAQVAKALALMEAHDAVSAIVDQQHRVYVTPTTSETHPLGAVVTDGRGICAIARGTCKDDLAERIRQQLRPPAEGRGECA